MMAKSKHDRNRPKYAIVQNDLKAPVFFFTLTKALESRKGFYTFMKAKVGSSCSMHVLYENDLSGFPKALEK